jgi:hypothetical protein
MSRFWNVIHYQGWKNDSRYGKGRGNQHPDKMSAQLDEDTLNYLDEAIINHIGDSISLLELWQPNYSSQFNDFSFLTAPAYKAFEGFLFQIARDLKLPSAGNVKFAGTYFDEDKVDEAIDNIIKEIEEKADNTKALDKEQTQFIKDMVSEMKRFLVHYRHTPAHFLGDSINSLEKAQQNIMSIYRIINETTKTLLRAGLIEPINDIH